MNSIQIKVLSTNFAEFRNLSAEAESDISTVQVKLLISAQPRKKAAYQTHFCADVLLPFLASVIKYHGVVDDPAF
jgi:hypothetical protein